MLAQSGFRLCQETEHWPRLVAVTVRQKCLYKVFSYLHHTSPKLSRYPVHVTVFGNSYR